VAGASADVRTALAESGALGATVRQIARRLGAAVASVDSDLRGLASRGEVVRMGRGLWVLQDFDRLELREDFTEPAVYAERFALEDGIPLGTYRGPITFRSNEGLPFHRWWPYVQGYSAEFVSNLLRSDGLRRGSTVLDPFAGSGTSLIEAQRIGARAIGYELMAPAALAARVKTDIDLAPGDLERAAAVLLRTAQHAPMAALPFLRETRRQFSPEALAQLRRIRSVLPAADARGVTDALRLAFAATLVPVSRLRRSPCLGYDPVDRERPLPFVQYAGVIRTMVEDLRARARSSESRGPPAEVRSGDSRSIDLPAQSVDLAITSPPYVNGLDYVMNYKLDLAWLGYVNSYSELSALRIAELACDNLPRTATRDYLGTNRTPDPWLEEILPRIRENVARKGTYRRNDMHGVVHRYFRDLADVLRGVYRALRPGGRFVLVVGDSLLAGTYVPGDLLTARIGRSLGFRIESVDVARARHSGQRRQFLLRESIVTLTRPNGREPQGKRRWKQTLR
jgi:DNA modification methylase